MNHSQHHSEQIEIGANPCTDQLTDLEYLEHMIPHHQVAIDMSKRLEPHISSDIILKFFEFLHHRLFGVFFGVVQCNDLFESCQRTPPPNK